MLHAILILLVIIALYSGYCWATWVGEALRSRRHSSRYSPMLVQVSAIGAGTGAILAIGFVGLILALT